VKLIPLSRRYSQHNVSVAKLKGLGLFKGGDMLDTSATIERPATYGGATSRRTGSSLRPLHPPRF